MKGLKVKCYEWTLDIDESSDIRWVHFIYNLPATQYYINLCMREGK